MKDNLIILAIVAAVSVPMLTALIFAMAYIDGDAVAMRFIEVARG
jgi:hypothetical protein